MFDMLTGCPPFSADSKRETQYKVLHDQIKLPAYLSPDAKDLLKNLLKRNHASRLGAGERDADEIKVYYLGGYTGFNTFSGTQLVWCNRLEIVTEKRIASLISPAT